MTGDPVPRRRERYTVEWMDNECLIYRSPAKTAIYLNETATVIWKLCDGRRTAKEIVDLLADAFPEAASDIRADVKETIDELVNSGVLALKAPEEEEAVGSPAAGSELPGDARSE
jgi:hypothetical protein